MDPDKAKEILSVYREDLAHEEGLECRQALALLEEDPVLAAWFDQERRFDRNVAQALQSIPVPGDLRERILAAAGSSFEVAEASPGVELSGRSPKRSPVRTWWAAAAALVIVAISLFRYFAVPAPEAVAFPGTDFSSIDAFRNDMALYAAGSFKLTHKTNNFVEARDWLQARRSPAYESVPGAIVAFDGLGCQSFLWGDHAVSLICFRNENDEVIHLFIIDRSSLEDLQRAAPLEEVLVHHRLETGGWVDDQRLYLLVGSDPDVGIGDLLNGAG